MSNLEALGPLGLFAAISACALCLVRARKRHGSKGLSREYCIPSTQGVNRLPAHSPLCAFGSSTEARKYVGQPRASPHVEYLSGKDWRFRLYGSVEEAFAAVGGAATGLAATPVPGNWQLDVPGDSPAYTNISYIIPVDPPHVPRRNPTGYYR